jgi:hypothetical protein
MQKDSHLGVALLAFNVIRSLVLYCFVFLVLNSLCATGVFDAGAGHVWVVDMTSALSADRLLSYTRGGGGQTYYVIGHTLQVLVLYFSLLFIVFIRELRTDTGAYASSYLYRVTNYASVLVGCGLFSAAF